MAFDEATHPVIETIVPELSPEAQQILDSNPDAKRKSGNVITTGIVHSQCVHCKLQFRDVGTGESFEAEELVIPPRSVQNTTWRCTFVAVVEALEVFAFGVTLREFMMTLQFCCLVFVMVAADNATSNGKMLVLFRWIFIRAASFVGLIVFDWYEKCNLHQLGRIRGDLCDRYSMGKQMRASAKLLINCKNRKTFRVQLKASLWIVEQHDSVVLSQACLAKAEQTKRQLYQLLVKRSAHEEALEFCRSADGVSADVDGTLGAYGPVKDKYDAALTAILQRCNNWDVGSGAGSVDGTEHVGVVSLSETKAQIVDKLHQDFSTFVLVIIKVFNSGRWHLQLPALKQWVAMACLPGVRHCWLHVQFQCEENVDDTNLSAARRDRRKADGVKMKAGRQYIACPRFVLQHLIVLVFSDLTEYLARIMFEASPVGWTRKWALKKAQQRSESSRVAGDGSVAVDAGAAAAAAAQSCIKTKDISDVVDGVEDTLAVLLSLLGGMKTDHRISELTLFCEAFWPSEVSQSACRSEVFGVGMVVVGGLILRFSIRHAFAPYNCLKSKGKSIRSSVKGISVLCNSEQCCTRHVRGLVQYIEKDSLGGTKEQRAEEGVGTFCSRCQVATVPEERAHSDFHQASENTVQSFSRRASTVMVQDVSRIWAERGGRDITTAPPSLRQSFAMATNREIAGRQRQFGREFMSWKEQFITDQDSWRIIMSKV